MVAEGVLGGCVGVKKWVVTRGRWVLTGERVLILAMAVNVLMPLLIPLGEQITNVTQGGGRGGLVFAQPLMEVFVKENTAAPVLLLTIHASSNTSAWEVLYNVVGGGVGGLFQAHPHTGDITLTQPLDYETQNLYEVIVGGQSGEERAYGRVLIRVLDDNDLPPTFSRPVFETQITEEDDRHLPKAILQVMAEDGDESDIDKLQYSLSGEDKDSEAVNSTFSISAATGHIHLLRPLDRDEPNGRARWRLWVAATDGTHTAHAQVHVNVKDINDNAPFFPSHVIDASVLENSDAGTEVTRVKAIDLDDPTEGNNAAVTYSVDKNVIDETSGRPIFSIHSASGTIRTALCCLDREQTPSFVIQVVASDGGGLKGTGTVVVNVGDQNDVGPRFKRNEWKVRVAETVSPETTLALLSVHDPDITNEFAYRVVSGSGYGWDRFTVVGGRNHSGALQALQPLDYEDPKQRRGFRFKVQVTDKGEGWWHEKAGDTTHIDEAWVNVTLRDDNDNDPHLTTRLVNLTLSEDAPAGHSLASFPASDVDQDGKGQIRYAIDPRSDPGRQFGVDGLGRVWLQRSLDREVAPIHTVRVWAVDKGEPARTATATLLITVLDVNDNPPHVSAPSNIQVPENSWPRHIGDITLGDADDWTLGHGPPFTITLDVTAPQTLKRDFRVDFDSKGDNGNGVAVLTSLRPLDREQSTVRLIPLVVTDAGGLSATVTVTVTIADVNDNSMKPGDKNVYVTRITGQEGGVPLGRVYIDDADDWDAGDKTWEWARRSPHPLFTLDPHSGQLAMAARARDGRYSLQFWVSDAKHKQVDVPANVTVHVTSLTDDVVPWAVPVTLTSHSPHQLLTRGKVGGTSGLDSIVGAVKKMAGKDVVLVSLEPRDISGTSLLWLASRPTQPLDQLLLLHKNKMEELGVTVGEVGVGVCLRPLHPGWAGGSSSWLVDANTTAVVTPRFVTATDGCSCKIREPQILQRHQQEPQHQRQVDTAEGAAEGTAGQEPSVAAVTRPTSCQPNPCLNGGRCIANPRGPSCVCPHGTSGSICKQLSRRFGGKGWAWVSPVPSCSQVHLTLHFRASCTNCLLLYAGPEAVAKTGTSNTPSSQFVQEDVLSVELFEGRPRVMLDFGTSPVLLSQTHSIASTAVLANSSSTNSAINVPSLADGRWHRLDVIWAKQRAEMIIDTCEGGGECRVWASMVAGVGGLRVVAPLQVGGMRHPPPDHQRHGWPAPVSAAGFHGCIRNIRINGELRDLGKEVLSENSLPGCLDQKFCQQSGKHCSKHSRCVEGVEGVQINGCECEPGWTGPNCNERTKPASFGTNSYVKMALTQSPSPNTTSLQLRFRTWESSGQLLAVTSHHGRDRFLLQLVGGKVCAVLLLHPRPPTRLCLSRAHLADGTWHTVRTNRYGEWLEVVADEGDGPLYNATATPASPLGWTAPFLLDRHEGVLVGGWPEYVGVSLHKVHNDFRDGCLDDIRVSGINLPLPPLVNATQMAQAAMYTNIKAACNAPPACTNVTCPDPLTCVDVWRRHECGCGEGASLLRETGTCRDVNECLWSPCFNGGTCVNRQPGYVCLCPKPFIGLNCAVAASSYPPITLSLSAILIVIILSFIILAFVVAAFVLYRRRRCRREGKSPHSSEDLSTPSQTYSDQGKQKCEMDVQQIGPSSSSSEQREQQQKSTAALRSKDAKQGGGKCGKVKGSGCGCPPNLCSLDDLRYYAYEGDGTSPGSLSSCCSGVEGVEEVKLLGGFQDVAALLNCLSGQTSSLSPVRLHTTKHKHEPPRQTPFNITEAKEESKKYIEIQETKEPCHNPDLAHRKCNSLPRPRVAKIFVNNLHDYASCSDRNCHSLRRHLSTDKHLEEKCCSGGHYCTNLVYKSGVQDGAQGECLACSSDARENGDRPSDRVRRSRSTTAVSYILTGSDVGYGGDKSCSCNSEQKTLSPSTTALAVISNKGISDNGGGKRFLL